MACWITVRPARRPVCKTKDSIGFFRGCWALPRGGDGNLGGAARRGASFGPANGPHLAAVSPAAEEQFAAIGLEARNDHSGRHLDPLQNLSRSRIDSPQIALVAFPGAVPQLSVDPGDSGNEAIGLDRAENRPCLGIDL